MNILQCWAVRMVLRSYPAEKLTHSEHAAMAKHIANCPECARERSETIRVLQMLDSVNHSPVLDEPARRKMEKAIMNGIKVKQFPPMAAYPMNLFAEIYEDFRQDPVMTGCGVLFSIICGIFQFVPYFH